MAYFTADPTLASSYAQGKQDTSLGQDYDGDYAQWFKVKIKGERAARWSGDLLAAVSFIGWHDAGAMVGGYRARDAFEALCRLLNLEPHEMRKIIGTDKSNA